MRKTLIASLVGVTCLLAAGASLAVTGEATDQDGKVACQKAIADFKSKAQGKAYNPCRCAPSPRGGQVVCRVEEKK